MLLVTPGRELAIENIRRAALEGRFNDKTEPFDPQISPQALKADILGYVSRLNSPVQKLKTAVARAVVRSWVRKWSEPVNEITGIRNLLTVQGPAFLTSNHFNPFDNGVHRTLSRLTGRDRLVAISQGTNFVMPGLNGFILRNIDVIPLIQEPSYMNGAFRTLMRRSLDRNRFILIYPEQEMWFNYRKPRPGKGEPSSLRQSTESQWFPRLWKWWIYRKLWPPVFTTLSLSCTCCRPFFLTRKDRPVKTVSSCARPIMTPRCAATSSATGALSLTHSQKKTSPVSYSLIFFSFFAGFVVYLHDLEDKFVKYIINPLFYGRN